MAIGLSQRVREALAAERSADLLLDRIHSRLPKVLAAAATASAYDQAALLSLLEHAGSVDRPGRDEPVDLAARNLLNQVSVLRKEKIRNSLHRLVAGDPGPVDVRVTSGTSGLPTQLARPRDAVVERAAIDRRLYSSIGLPSFFELTVLTPWRGSSGRRHTLYDWRIGYRVLSLDDIGRLPRDGLVVTSPRICRTLIQDGLVNRNRLASAWEVSEPTRGLLEGRAGAQAEAPYELYVAAELTAPVAFRPAGCSFLHINVDAVLVEVISSTSGQPQKSGVVGHLVVTDLLNTATPFVRYELGDLGAVIYGRCDCGRITPRLKLLGRAGPFESQAARLLQDERLRKRGIVIECGDASALLMTDDWPVNRDEVAGRVVQPIPTELRGLLPLGTAISIRDRFPPEVWAHRGVAEVTASQGDAPYLLGNRR
ncbi:phenylacetate--CoA ligase family protein [Parafrankia elaeagni]|uniref:hypothetical protein n=1 Tax=Parafrankia elaeagni TaxID=222534 RepID=UPI00039B4E08|nr:hypothetical protein [Parafrankia elaeagni]